jgi:hypothetical protein
MGCLVKKGILVAQFLYFPDCFGVFRQLPLAGSQFVFIPRMEMDRDGFGQFAVGLLKPLGFFGIGQLACFAVEVFFQ